MKLEYSPIMKNNIPYAAKRIEINKRDFTQKKPVLRLGIGLKQMITKNVGVRAMVHWERLDRFKNLAPKQTSILRASLKNSVQCGIGLFWQF